MSARIRNLLFIFSGVLVLTGASLYLVYSLYASYIFAVGAAGISVCYLTVLKNENFRIRRLNRLNAFAGLALVIASIFMFRGGMEWVIFMLISTAIQLYTSFVISDEKK